MSRWETRCRAGALLRVLGFLCLPLDVRAARAVEALFSVSPVGLPREARRAELGLRTVQSTLSELIGRGGRKQLANQLAVLLFALYFQGLNVRLFKPDPLSCGDVLPRESVD